MPPLATFSNSPSFGRSAGGADSLSDQAASVTYQFIGEGLAAIKDHVTHGTDGDAVSHRGDVYRQVIYAKMIIVDRPGDTQ